MGPKNGTQKKKSQTLDPLQIKVGPHPGSDGGTTHCMLGSLVCHPACAVLPCFPLMLGMIGCMLPACLLRSALLSKNAGRSEYRLACSGWVLSATCIVGCSADLTITPDCDSACHHCCHTAIALCRYPLHLPAVVAVL